MNDNLVSVIIPSFNSASMVCQAVDSVLAQTVAAAEIIVVDDGSTDDTQARLLSYGEKVRRIFQGNEGVSAARNRGLREAECGMVAFLDADDVWHPRKLELQLAVLDELPDLGLIGSGFFDWPASAFPRIDAPPGTGRLVPVAWSELAVKNRFAASSVMVRRWVLDLVGEFDTTLQGPEDRDLWLRVAEVTRVANLDLPLMGYRGDVPGSVSKQAARCQSGMLRIMSKLEERGAWRGRPILRQKAYAYIYHSSSYLMACQSSFGLALWNSLRSFTWYPLPYRRSEVRTFMERPKRLAITSMRMIGLMRPVSRAGRESQAADDAPVPPMAAAAASKSHPRREVPHNMRDVLPRSSFEDGAGSPGVPLRASLSVVHVVLSMDVGGLERNVLNQVREGQALGQRVSVVCLERPGTLSYRVEELGGSVHFIDKRPGLRPGVIGRLKELFLELRPDVVHTHQIGTLIYAGPASRRAGSCLVVHTQHGLENFAGRIRTRWLGRLASRFTRVFYCLTKDMAAHVIAHRIAPPGKLRVIPNGIDTALYREPRAAEAEAVRRTLGIPADATLIGTVGRLVEIKRQDTLIRAFARLKARVVNSHLLLVGGGPLEDELRALAGRLGVGDSVHFSGYQADTVPFLQAMNIFALTSRSEGMPQAILEAAVAGLPIISSRVGGIPEVIEHGGTGLLFEPGEDSALAEGLLRLIADGHLARRLGDAARDRVVTRFDVGRMAREYHEAFLELLDAGATARDVSHYAARTARIAADRTMTPAGALRPDCVASP
jgi:glycosyltransferase involved in cell wall biosynthesis